MKRRLLILSGCLCCGLYMAAWFPGTGLTAHAKELAACGNLLYEDADGKAGIYESDFRILHEKLSMDSAEAFDPAYYTHTHLWEYRDVGEGTHTKHCEICGDEFDLTENHKGESEKDCTISTAQRQVPGRRFICACGYQWERETGHELTFDMVDETCHRSRCLLDGTAYCLGYEPVEEEHYAYYHIWDQTGSCCIKTCIDCGYQTEEAAPEQETQIEASGVKAEAAEPSEEDTEEAEPSEGETEAVEPSEEDTEATELSEEDTEATEPSEGETEEAEPSEEETEEAEPSEEETKPSESVSGNDCIGKETQLVTDEIRKKPGNEKGENL